GGGPGLRQAVHEDVGGVPRGRVLPRPLDQVDHQGVAPSGLPGGDVLDRDARVPVHGVAVHLRGRLATPLHGGGEQGERRQAVVTGDHGEVGGLQVPAADQLVVVVAGAYVHAALADVAGGLRMVGVDAVHAGDVVDGVEDLVAEVALHA